MRWEPMVISWCLYFHHLSTSMYETIRSSGVLKLPFQRKLRDYMHFTQVTSGFSSDIDRQHMAAAKIETCPKREKYVIILIVEIHIREDLHTTCM